MQVETGATPADIEADLQAYFGSSAGVGKTQQGDAFLQQFLARRLWAEEGDDAGDSRGLFAAVADAAAPPDSEDDDFLDHADDFERSYNFR